MNIVIYARYSSHSQTEQSIEGQLHTCYEYARNNGHIVIGEYIDRAQSGTTDSRVEFQRSIKRIKAAIQEADNAIENLWKALEMGQAADMITERIEKRQREKEELQAQLAIEMGKQVTLSAPQIRAYLNALKRGNLNDEDIKRGIINIFLRAVYLYDDRFTLVLNGSDKPVTIDDALLDEIEDGLNGELTDYNACSLLVADAPPTSGTEQPQPALGPFSRMDIRPFFRR